MIVPPPPPPPSLPPSQTGSGKTHTMEGAGEDDGGMIPRAVHQVFNTAMGLKERGWEVHTKVFDSDYSAFTGPQKKGWCSTTSKEIWSLQGGFYPSQVALGRTLIYPSYMGHLANVWDGTWDAMPYQLSSLERSLQDYSLPLNVTSPPSPSSVLHAGILSRDLQRDHPRSPRLFHRQALSTRHQAGPLGPGGCLCVQH